MRAWDLASRTPWAIEEGALRTILRIAAREDLDLDAIQRTTGQKLDGTRTVTVRDGTAIVPVVGPLFRYANIFTDISGATSYELLARDFSKAVDDPAIERIVLEIDSPGGEVNGVLELGELVFAARDVKPVIAFVSGAGTSGAYWLASAAPEVVASETALLGSIGVVATFLDDSKAMEMAGFEEIEIVSSQSPRKRPDPATDAGRAQIQTTINDLAEIFVGRVARNRGVTREKVIAGFGGGDVLVADKAVQAGMADRIGTLEGVLAEPVNGAIEMKETTTVQAPELPTIDAAHLEANHADLVEQYRAEGREQGRAQGAEAERARLLAIADVPSQGNADLVKAAMADPNATAGDLALQVLEAGPKAGDAHIAQLKADEDDLDVPGPAPTNDPEEEDSDKRVGARILGAGRVASAN